MPDLGTTVFVNERNDLTGDETVSPAIVTHVYTQDDGDKAWWDTAKDKAIVDVFVIRRNGTTESQTVGKEETVTADDGETYKVGYSATAGGAQAAPEPTPPPEPAPTPTPVDTTTQDPNAAPTPSPLIV